MSEMAQDWRWVTSNHTITIENRVPLQLTTRYMTTALALGDQPSHDYNGEYGAIASHDEGHIYPLHWL